MGLTRIRAEQISDIDFKQAVRVVTTTDITLSGSAPTVIDGVTLAANNRVLVAGQTTASQNGIYVVTTLGTGSNGTWTRSSDANATGEIEAGMILMVTAGTIYADTQWVLATNNPIVVGTTPLSFQQNITNTGNVSSGSSGIRVMANSNVLISVSGTANVATFAVDGLYITGNISTGNLAVGNDVVITGNLTVNGNTTTINSNVITTNDKSITLANNQSTSANVDGAGIDVGNPAIATWRYSNATASWQSNIGLTPAANATLALGGVANYWSTVFANTASLAGNVTSTGAVISNINATTISAAGNVTSGNIITGGIISATGNITGNYIIGNGSQLSGLTSYGNANVVANLAALGSNPVSTTGNVSAGNVLTSAEVIASGLVQSGTGLSTGGYLSIDGTTDLHNTTVTGNLSVTGNITGNYFIGNGSQLTGLASYGNANVVANLAALGSNPISTTGNITGNYFIGNGSQLSGLTSYGNANVVANLVALGSNPISTTGNITGNYFIGNGSALTSITGANVTGTVANATYATSTDTATTATTVTGAAQGNITSVGILTSLSVTGNVTGTNLYGTLQTATQLNVTGLGTLTALTVSGNTTSGNLLSGGLISVAGNVTGGNINTAGLILAAGNVTGGNLTTSGSVGIGTSSPSVKFQTVQTIADWTGDFKNYTAGAYGLRVDLSGSSGSQAALQVYTAIGNGMIVRNDGLVGIGTFSLDPSTLLTVAGAISATGTITGGNILTGGLISATGAITGAALTGTSLTVSTGNITGGNIVNANGNGIGNIGSSTVYFNTVFAKATSAQYADLAEMYVADADYPPGTVVDFGGVEEITQTLAPSSTAVAGVISTNPSYIMNSGQQGKHVLPVALTGRVPCRVQGPVSKGDVLVSSTLPGVAQRIGTQYHPGCVIGKSLGYIDDDSIQTIEVVVGRF